MPIEYNPKSAKTSTPVTSAKRGRKPNQNPDKNAKYDRLETNLPAGIKAIVEKYAQRRGMSTAKYILESLLCNMDRDDCVNSSFYIIKVSTAAILHDQDAEPGCTINDPTNSSTEIYQSNDIIDAVNYFGRFRSKASNADDGKLITEFVLEESVADKTGNVKFNRILAVSKF